MSIKVVERRPMPRRTTRSGPAILSYGFRPFFLAAGIYALTVMTVWLFALSGVLEVGGAIGAVSWHAHEMLFGYTTAALAGSLLTAIPNWTGRLPVSGMPLLALFTLWFVGRAAMLAPEALGAVPSAVVDFLFLPVLGVVVGREVVAGRNWKDLNVLFAVGFLSLSNLAFHSSEFTRIDTTVIFRAVTSVMVLLIVLIGGRIVPSFTRNFIAKAGGTWMPASFSWLDRLAVSMVGMALVGWTVVPGAPFVAIVALVAALLNVIRQSRWCTWQALAEPLLAMLHVGFGFVTLGLLAIGAATLGWISAASSMHVLTVGGIGGMTLAVMTRDSLGHTGRPTIASPATSIAYLLLLTAAVVRPLADLVSTHYHLMLVAGGAAWTAAFALYALEYGPILCQPSIERRVLRREA